MKRQSSIRAALAVCLMAAVLGLGGCKNRENAQNKEGLALYEEGRCGEAARMFEEAAAADDSCAEYRLNLAMARLGEEDPEGALAAAKEAEGLAPESAAVFRVQGIIYLEQEDYGQAVSCFESALKAPDVTEALERDVLLYKAEAELKGGDGKQAAADYDRLIEDFGESADYCLLRGAARMAAGDLEGAEADFDRVAELSPGEGADERALVSYYIALAQMEGGGCEEALASVREGLSEAEDENLIRELSYSEAVCLENLGEYEAALEKLKAYREAYGADEALDHEIAFLTTRVPETEAAGGEASQETAQ